MSSSTFETVITGNLPVSTEIAAQVTNMLSQHIVASSITDLSELNGPEISLRGVVFNLKEDADNHAVDIVLLSLSEILNPLDITICRYMGGTFEPSNAQICLLSSIRPAEIVEKVQVGAVAGWNTANSIFEAVRAWNREYGITILGVSYARIRMRFNTIPTDVDDITCKFFDLAPDLGAYAYGEGEVSDMLSAFGKTGLIELFWL
jgi:hypothetical protein